MKNIVLLAVIATTIAACANAPTGGQSGYVHYSGGGSDGGAGMTSAPDMDRLREAPTNPGETVRDDSTPNDAGQQGTNGGFNSSDQDSFGKPGKISG